MSKIHSHEDNKIDAEFDNLYQKADLYVVQVTTPLQPKSGMMWFNPSDGLLKIFKNTSAGWITI